MLKHFSGKEIKPSRVVVLGAGGFVGSALTAKLEGRGVDVLRVLRQVIDLESQDAGALLSEIVTENDTLVFISAKAPVKNVEMLGANIKMLDAVAKAVEAVSPKHILYVSSDAVYADSMKPLSEASSAEPSTLHGVMHLARETGLKHSYSGPLAILRPTLIFGAADPHNGYGPNRFCRQAQAREKIVLFGEGEERRDHVFVEDVAELAARMIMHRSTGILNAATGTVTSFRECAEIAVRLFDSSSEVVGSERVGPMPHNGYRPFDPANTYKAFPDFTYTSLEAGLKKSHSL
ncbi:SDR family oxidoreductase [Thalassospira lucentensis]|uniref:NAD-dependent epimerase/dehydratase family protein n=1 Tax=Thalassospira lucentensis TaxID=168935 RepID=UPI002943733A|nr:SDR family oxidoreductase [Thalassospira lucentensis]WOI11811.1 SDR family oxidoreductase [Thalassospira lucentensis]